MEFSQEPSISESDTTRSVDSNGILVVLLDFYYNASLVPFQWFSADLVLDPDMIAHS